MIINNKNEDDGKNAKNRRSDDEVEDDSKVEVDEKEIDDEAPDGPSKKLEEVHKKRKSALLMYSGGFDSTMLLAHLTGYKGCSMRSFHHQECEPYVGVSHEGPLGVKDLTDYRRVRVAAIYCRQRSRPQMERQIMARSIAIARIQQAVKVNVELDLIETDYGGPGSQGCRTNNGMTQQQASIYFGCSILDTDEDLVIGWHHEDCGKANIERLNRMFIDHAHLLGKQSSRLITPLLGTFKVSIVESIHELGLWDCCTTCESGSRFPFGGHCGHCTPCRNLLGAITGGHMRSQVASDILSTFDDEAIDEYARYTSHMVDEARKKRLEMMGESTKDEPVGRRRKA